MRDQYSHLGDAIPEQVAHVLGCVLEQKRCVVRLEILREHGSGGLGWRRGGRAQLPACYCRAPRLAACWARRARSTRLALPVLRRMFDTCELTVFSLWKSSRAISP